MMNSFIIFIFAEFDDHEDVEFFCTEVFGTNPNLSSIKYVIETNTNNIIVIFDSEYDHKTLSTELHEILKNENIKFYFMFEKTSLITAHLPEQLKDMIFRPNKTEDATMMMLDFNTIKNKPMDLDELLDKIDILGIESLTPEEKNFLDNFEK